MTCKDCIHYEVCKGWARMKGYDLEKQKITERSCENFEEDKCETCPWLDETFDES